MGTEAIVLTRRIHPNHKRYAGTLALLLVPLLAACGGPEAPDLSQPYSADPPQRGQIVLVTEVPAGTATPARGRPAGGEHAGPTPATAPAEGAEP